MRIENIANQAYDNCYELTIVGTEKEVESFAQFTQYTTDFMEEGQFEGEFEVTVMGNDGFGKKEFRAAVAAELKAFRKANK